jgi:SAM-dependent methyltransferase
MEFNSLFPSIWLRDYAGIHEFDADSSARAELFNVLDAIDDRVLVSRHPFSIKAYCVACNKSTNMHVTWHFGGANGGGSIHPAWTETVRCECCGLNSRMRALLDFLLRRSERNFNKVYIAESITPGYQVIKKLWPDVIGSEYLGTECYSGEISNSSEFKEPVRHEDLTRLSFGNDEFDLVITQDVFEHIPGYTNAFSECFRILSSSGLLVFTIPFFPANELTQIRASLKSDGSIEHHLPPEFHGNPVSNKGSLCFQNFGWDILPTLTAVGFSEAKASMYWGPWQGHLGFPFFIFSAVKS